MSASVGAVDHAAPRTNQALIVGLLLGAFVADSPWLVALVAAVMLAGTLAKRPGFAPVYPGLGSLNLIRPDAIPDNPEPRRFARGLGGVALLVATAGFITGLSALGWVLVWLVIALAALNLFAGSCVGCALDYWLNRLGTPGFSHFPPPWALPGRRPPALR
jgi:hypothetical protein